MGWDMGQSIEHKNELVCGTHTTSKSETNEEEKPVDVVLHVRRNSTTNRNNITKNSWGKGDWPNEWPKWNDSTSLSCTWGLSNIPHNNYVNCCCCCCWWCVCCFFHNVHVLLNYITTFRRCFHISDVWLHIIVISFFCLFNLLFILSVEGMI